MWIEAEGPHRIIVNTAKLDTMYVAYKGTFPVGSRVGANCWAVIGSVGDRDIYLRGFKSETDANGWLGVIRARIESK